MVKVLFSNLPSKKGMSYVTYPMRERVNLAEPTILAEFSPLITAHGSVRHLAAVLRTPARSAHHLPNL
jgi:hypothetical protein